MDTIFVDDNKFVNRIDDCNIEILVNNATKLIIMWVVSPLIIMALNAFDVNGFDVYTIWIDYLYLIGALGLINGLLYLYKIASSNKTDLKHLFISFLPLAIVFLFWVWCLVCCLLSENKSMALFGRIPFSDSLFTYFLYGGFILSGSVIARDNEKIRLVAYWFVGVSTVVAMISLMNNEITTRLCFVEYYTNCPSYYGVFYNTNHYGYYLIFSILVLAFLFLYAKSKIEMLLYASLFVVHVYLLILNNTFGVYLSILLTLVFLVAWSFVSREGHMRKKVILVFLFVVVSLFSCLYTNNVILNFVSLFGDTSLLSNFLAGAEDKNTLAIGSGRGALWKNAFENICISPLFGYGLENAGPILIDYTPNLRPHNIVLEYAQFLGIPGAMLYLSLYVVGIFRLYKSRQVIEMVSKNAAFLVICYFISSLVGVSRFYTSPYFLIVLGVCMADCYGEFSVHEIKFCKNL